MEKLILGIHHVSVSCVSAEEYAKAKAFYGDVLGLPLVREWKGGAMFDTGSGIVEVFNSAKEILPQGTIRHFAFRTESVDACLEAVKNAGYEIISGPRDVTIASEPAFPIRVGFCHGPVGEEIEFFQLR